MVVDERSFRRARNKRGNATTLGKIAYRGPNASPSIPKVKLDLTSDEALVAPPVLRPIGHPYSDVLSQARVLSYSIAELFGEKSPELAERCRPRDLYDVVHLHRYPDLSGRAGPVRHALERKCEDAGIEVPSDDTIRSSPFRTEIEEEWENMLGHQPPRPLLPFSAFWSALDRIFGWLDGSSPTTPLLRGGPGRHRP